MDTQQNRPATNQEMETAREVFQRAVATDPSNADAWLRLSYATQRSSMFSAPSS